MERYDLIVVGSGPAGYTGAIRAAQLGMRVACIEKKSSLGGTCLNVGCIPSKVLLNFSRKYYEALNSFNSFGIECDVKLNLKTMFSKKEAIVSELCNGIEMLFKKNKITTIHGNAEIMNNNIVSIKTKDAVSEIYGNNILIATGSKISKLPNITIDEERIISSTGALKLQKVPNNLCVIGGGYIGLELGSVWSRFGSKVRIIEASNSIAASLDKEIREQFIKILKKQSIEFILDSSVLTTRFRDKDIILEVQNNNSMNIDELLADIVLVSVGRRANTSSLGLERVGVILDSYGRIKVNKLFQTNVLNIYAVGDVIEGPMLAHKAEEEAITAVEIISGQFGSTVNYNLIPSVIYTFPEVAVVGLTEEELQKTNVKYKVGKFPLLANSKARVECHTDGLVKILADSNSDKILGAHIIGDNASVMIAELVAFMEFGASAEDVARTCHAHPTISEAIKEAALAVEKRAINF